MGWEREQVKKTGENPKPPPDGEYLPSPEGFYAPGIFSREQ